MGFTVLPCRTLDVTLDLKDPQYPENNLGSLELAVTLSPKEGDVRDAVRKLYTLIHLSFFLHTPQVSIKSIIIFIIEVQQQCYSRSVKCFSIHQKGQAGCVASFSLSYWKLFNSANTYA